MAPLFSFLLMALSVITLNVNGVRDSLKRAGLLQWLHSLLPYLMLCVFRRVIVLQPVSVSPGFCLLVFPLLSLPVLINPVVVLLFRPSLSFIDSWSDSEGRFLQCEFSFQMYALVFVFLLLIATC